MIGKTLDHYQITSQLGKGGMGEVYQAKDHKLGRDVAIKVLPEEFAKDTDRVARFQREAKLLASLNHPNIAAIYGLEESDGTNFLVLELVEGETLADRIKAGPIPVGEALRLALQIAEALEAAHKKGVIHRDLKPANIMVTDEGSVKLLDFGLARLYEQDTPVSSLPTADFPATQAGAVLGTVAYMSPEQACGEVVDVRSDVFSLGVVLYEMATGQIPFHGVTPALTYDAILHKQPVPIQSINPNVTADLALAIHKALEKDRKLRYQSARDLLLDLGRLKLGQHVSIPSHSRPLSLALSFALMLLFVLVAPLVWRAFRPSQVPRIPGTRDIAVIPFSSAGDILNHQDISGGLTEGITSKLTQLEKSQQSLQVVAASEVRSRKISSVEDARKYFGISLVVTGNFQCYKDASHLILNLVDAKSLRQLDSRTIDGNADDPWALQEKGVVQLAEMLQLKVLPDSFSALAAEESKVRGASAFYLEARGNLYRYDRPEKLEAAIRLFEDAIAKDKDFALAYAGLAEAHWRKYQRTKETRWLDLARQESDKALQLGAGIALVHVTSGIIHAGKGEYDLAFSEFEHALKADSRNSDAYRELARVYNRLNRIDEAEATYKKAIQLRPNLVPGYNLLGNFYYEHGRYEEAAAQFRKVIDLAPDGYWGYNNLGGAYLNLERWTEARGMFEKVLQTTTDWGALSNLGTLDFDEGRFAEAARMYEKAIEQNPKKYDLYYNLASAYYWMPGFREKATENYRKAVQMAEQELKVNPKSTYALSHLALCYAMLGDQPHALAPLQEALALQPSNTEVLFRAVLVYEKLGERAEAFVWLKKAVENGCSRGRIERSPELRALSKDPRYHALLRKMNLES